MFRWGILSAAKIARDHMLPAIQQAENGMIAAIASRDRQRAEAVARRYAIPRVFASYEELLTSQEIDGVYLPLPNSLHLEWTLRALACGKHVLCEKPLAMSGSEVAQVIAARDVSGLTVCEAFAIYYHPQWSKVADLLSAGVIGRLRHVQAAYSYLNSDPSNLRNQLELGGGGLRDIGVYPAMATRMATGAEPLRVQARIETDPEFGTDRYALVTADFGYFDLSFYCSTRMALRQFVVFHGETGFIEVHAPFNAGVYDHPRIELHDSRHGRAEVFRFPGVQQYRLQVEAFADAATGKGARLLPLVSSLANQRLTDSIFRSASSGKWEDV
jgi:predicted dehydrogenase